MYHERGHVPPELRNQRTIQVTEGPPQTQRGSQPALSSAAELLPKAKPFVFPGLPAGRQKRTVPWLLIYGNSFCREKPVASGWIRGGCFSDVINPHRPG